MFGYVTVNKPELKIREFERYRGFYCGLCHCLKEKYGITGQITLTYDMTFLVLLLSSLYEPHTVQVDKRCVVHPLGKHRMIFNEISEYASDMNILLTYDHLEDDWKDEKKIRGLLGMKVYSGKKKKVIERYPRQAAVIEDALSELAKIEQENCREPDVIARPFGRLMEELFVWKEDSFQNILRPFGFYLGKYIYLLDAYEDVEKDRKKGCFNPFLENSKEEGFDERMQEVLDGTLRMAIIEFEKLPCEQDLEIMRNILYEGVRTHIKKEVRGGKR